MTQNFSVRLLTLLASSVSTLKLHIYSNIYSENCWYTIDGSKNIISYCF